MRRLPLKEGLLSTVEEGAGALLLGGHCTGCRRLHFPASQNCPYCSEAACEVRPLSPTGTIEVCTVVLRKPPGYEGPVPFGVGVVELPEGIRIVAPIDCVEAPLPGTPVRLALRSVGTDAEGAELITYAFAPEIG